MKHKCALFVVKSRRKPSKCTFLEPWFKRFSTVQLGGESLSKPNERIKNKRLLTFIICCLVCFCWTLRGIPGVLSLSFPWWKISTKLLTRTSVYLDDILWVEWKSYLHTVLLMTSNSEKNNVYLFLVQCNDEQIIP